MATIDELDVEILARLTENARVGVAELEVLGCGAVD